MHKYYIFFAVILGLFTCGCGAKSKLPPCPKEYDTILQTFAYPQDLKACYSKKEKLDIRILEEGLIGMYLPKTNKITAMARYPQGGALSSVSCISGKDETRIKTVEYNKEGVITAVELFDEAEPGRRCETSYYPNGMVKGVDICGDKPPYFKEGYYTFYPGGSIDEHYTYQGRNAVKEMFKYAPAGNIERYAFLVIKDDSKIDINYPAVAPLRIINYDKEGKIKSYRLNIWEGPLLGAYIIYSGGDARYACMDGQCRQQNNGAPWHCNMQDGSCATKGYTPPQSDLQSIKPALKAAKKTAKDFPNVCKRSDIKHKFQCKEG